MDYFYIQTTLHKLMESQMFVERAYYSYKNL